MVVKVVMEFQLIRILSGNESRFGDGRGAVVAKSNQRRMPLGQSAETAPSDIVFERRMAPKVRVGNAVMYFHFRSNAYELLCL